MISTVHYVHTDNSIIYLNKLNNKYDIFNCNGTIKYIIFKYEKKYNIKLHYNSKKFLNNTLNDFSNSNLIKNQNNFNIIYNPIVYPSMNSKSSKLINPEKKQILGHNYIIRIIKRNNLLKIFNKKFSFDIILLISDYIVDINELNLFLNYNKNNYYSFYYESYYLNHSSKINYNDRITYCNDVEKVYHLINKNC
jgi:hypothetical protein